MCTKTTIFKYKLPQVLEMELHWVHPQVETSYLSINISLDCVHLMVMNVAVTMVTVRALGASGITLVTDCGVVYKGSGYMQESCNNTNRYSYWGHSCPTIQTYYIIQSASEQLTHSSYKLASYFKSWHMCQIHPRNQPIAKHDDKTGFDPEIIFLPDSYTPSDSYTNIITARAV